jgi:hypothetical protein
MPVAFYFKDFPTLPLRSWAANTQNSNENKKSFEFITLRLSEGLLALPTLYYIYSRRVTLVDFVWHQHTHTSINRIIIISDKKNPSFQILDASWRKMARYGVPAAKNKTLRNWSFNMYIA